MLFPDYRGRRMRATPTFRRMIRETVLTANDLILPLFAIEGRQVKKPIDSMPGHFQMSGDHIVDMAVQANEAGIPAIIYSVFPIKRSPCHKSLCQGRHCPENRGDG